MESSHLPIIDDIVSFYGKLTVQNYNNKRILLQRLINHQSNYLSTNLINLKRRINASGSTIIRDTLDKLQFYIKEYSELKEDLQKSFTIFVVGMGKYGKSTLINSLVGGRVAEMDVLPKTWKIDVFYGNDCNENVIVKYVDGSKDTFKKQVAINLIKEEEEKRAESEKQIDKEYKNKSTHLSSLVEKEELKLFLNTRMLYKSKITEVKWPCKKNDFLSKFEIVDTPGLWQEYGDEKTKQDLRSYYHKADGVLWMLDATKITSNKSNELLTELESAIEKVGTQNNNMIGVLNRIDLISSSSTNNIEIVLKEAEKIFGSYFREIIPFSAKKALIGLESNDQEMIKSSYFPDLIKSINNNFYNNAASLQCNSKQHGIIGYNMSIKDEIEKYLLRLNNDDKERIKLINELDNQSMSLLKSEKSKLSTILKNYQKRVQNNIENKADRLFDFEENQKTQVENYIKNDIFMQKSLEKELYEYEEKFKNIVQSFHENMARASKFSEFKYIDKIYHNLIQSNMFQHSSSIDQQRISTSNATVTVGIGSIIALGLMFGPIGAIAMGVLSMFGFVKWIVKQFKLPGVINDLNGHLVKTVNEVERKIIDNIDNSVRQVIVSINNIRENSFTDIHFNSKYLYDFKNDFENMTNECSKPIPNIQISDLINGRINYDRIISNR